MSCEEDFCQARLTIGASDAAPSQSGGKSRIDVLGHRRGGGAASRAKALAPSLHRIASTEVAAESSAASCSASEPGRGAPQLTRLQSQDI